MVRRGNGGGQRELHLCFPNRFKIWQECGNKTGERRERTEAEDSLQAIDIDKVAENGSSYTSHAECETEEKATDKTKPIGQHLLRIEKNGGESGRKHEAGAESHGQRAVETTMRENEAERSRSENGNPDDILAANLIADRASDNGAGSRREEEYEQGNLRERDGDTELVHHIESEEIGQGGHVDILRKDEHRNDANGEDGHAFGQRTIAMGRDGGMSLADGSEVGRVPSAHGTADNNGQQSDETKPRHIGTSERRDKGSHSKRAERRAEITPDLKDGLRSATMPTRREGRDAACLGVKN